MAIHQTNMYRINVLRTQQNFQKDDYYYASDTGWLYQATDAVSIQMLNGIYFVVSDFDRRNNIPKITGKYYYCIEANQLWQFAANNTWEFVDGNYSHDYNDTGFYEGNFIFTKEKSSTPLNSGITTTFHKINNVVFGQVTSSSSPQGTVIAELEEDFRPSADTTVYIQVSTSASILANINASTGVITVNATEITQIDKGTRYWFTLD